MMVVTDHEVTGSGWVAVRCIFRCGRTYEERVTLWRADSMDEAIALAEVEAEEYAADLSGPPLPTTTYLGSAQAYRLFDEPVHRGEVFSLLRDSELPPDVYLHQFFETGAERQGEPLDDA